MNRMARILGGVSLAGLAACGTSTGGTPDAGPDAGNFPAGGQSTGTAYFSGVASGTAPASALAEYSKDFPVPESSNVLAFSVEAFGAAGDSNFSCSGVLSGAVLQAGTFTQADVTTLDCELMTTPPGGNQEFWNVVLSFELTISSPGPTDALGITWDYPTGSLDVSLGPLPNQELGGDGGLANVYVTFAPP